MSRHVAVRWEDAAFLGAKRNQLERDLAHLNPQIDRASDSATAAIIQLDVPDAQASTDDGARKYALKVLNETLVPDDNARVVSVALDSTTEAAPAPAPQIESTPRVADPKGAGEQDIIDVEEVPLGEVKDDPCTSR